MTQSQTYPGSDSLEALKLQIADVVAQRDALKQAIESGRQAASEGLRKLVLLDEKLSKLDTAFKQGWDATRG
jgi:uncharacterized protein YaaN involved in tellurite resistance